MSLFLIVIARPMLFTFDLGQPLGLWVGGTIRAVDEAGLEVAGLLLDILIPHIGSGVSN